VRTIFINSFCGHVTRPNFRESKHSVIDPASEGGTRRRKQTKTIIEHDRPRRDAGGVWRITLARPQLTYIQTIQVGIHRSAEMN
jgi:hypothetical protein